MGVEGALTCSHSHTTAPQIPSFDLRAECRVALPITQTTTASIRASREQETSDEESSA